MLTATLIAHYFLWRAQLLGDSMTHLEVQKLCYYAQGFYAGMRNEPLFQGRVEAWQYGPVSPEIWQLHRYRRDPLRPPVDFDANAIDEETQLFLNLVYERFRRYSGAQLISLTHREPPWREAWERTRSGGDSEITVESMAAFFGPRLAKLEVAEAAPPADRDRVARELRSSTEFTDGVRAGRADFAAERYAEIVIAR